MADTNHGHASTATAPVEGDGISYRGIVWFVVIMAITVVGSQLLMVGALTWFEHENARSDAARPPLARPQGQMPPGPNLLYLRSGSPQLNEPGNLEQFREREETILHSYAYDENTGIARIPIDRAKDLLLERGLLPAREGAGAAPETSAAPAETPAAGDASGQ